MAKPDMRMVPACQWEEQLQKYRQGDRIQVLITRAQNNLTRAQKNLDELKTLVEKAGIDSYLGKKI
jgi:hypothetical protein